MNVGGRLVGLEQALARGVAQLAGEIAAIVSVLETVDAPTAEQMRERLAMARTTLDYIAGLIAQLTDGAEHVRTILRSVESSIAAAELLPERAQQPARLDGRV